MNALVPATCLNSAQTAAKAALIRRVEAASRANEERQDAPRDQRLAARSPAPFAAPQPAPALAAHILGARAGYANENGYSAYAKANRLLALESHVVDVTLG
jgi:hypothetical protein